MDISKHLEKAEEAVRRKNFDMALGFYEQLLSIQPDNLRARKGILTAAWRRYEYKTPMRALVLASTSPAIAAAKSLQAVKRWPQAAEQYQKAMLSDPTNAGWGLALGESLEQAGWREGALGVYEYMAEQDAKNLDALKRAGALFYAKKDLAQALEYYEKALAVNPRDQESLKARKNLAAEGILQQKGFETATSSRDLIKNKDEQRALEQSQRVHKTEEELGSALEKLTTKSQQDPQDWRSLEQIAQIHEKRGSLDLAIDFYQKAVAIEPNSFDLKTRLDDVQVKRFDHEIEELKKAGDADPANAEKLKKLEEKKLNFQLKQAGKRVSEHPTDLGLRFKYGRLLYQVGWIDEAMGDLQKAVADPRWKLDCYVLLGQCFFRKGLHDLARKQLEKALELVSPSSARAKEILYNLGVIAERMGARGDAFGYFSRIYELDIGYKDVATKIEQLKVNVQ